MEFKKYNSITNTYDEEFIQKIKLQHPNIEKWCITEKIHGSNTCISYNYAEDTIKYGKRTSFLEEGEACYNVQDCLKPMEKEIRIVHKILTNTFEIAPTDVIMYGEVCGGSYPHPDVPRDNKATRVQKGVFYNNTNSWVAFDIAYKLPSDDYYHYVPSKTFNAICETLSIPRVPLLAVVNSLEEALEYPNNQPSVLHKQFNLPEIPNNIMEGVVIKPYEVDVFIGQTRVVLKNKNATFAEKSHAKKPDVQKELPENIAKVVAELQTYATENRVNNILSHYGQMSKAEKIQKLGMLICETNKEIIEEARKAGVFNTLETKLEVKTATGKLNHVVANLAKKVILS